ncbi:hypothetical protein N7533_000759 [Penicillium manginii]|uniref:uncharacterized protein n=1 Tax=Penicillium manginii TaxID=203109 RepID=UPI002547F12F|nr:uncharacterized protein N7533_000759 [Penicillium manginii]KAJ5768176.1 hypothetical protein N7533_000759 [Penicillium manginii]
MTLTSKQRLTEAQITTISGRLTCANLTEPETDDTGRHIENCAGNRIGGYHRSPHPAEVGDSDCSQLFQ